MCNFDQRQWEISSAQAGNFPADIDETSLVHALLVTLEVTNKFSLAVGAARPEDFMVFSGGVYDLALAHVGQTMGLLLIAPAGWAGGKQAKNLKNEMHMAVKDLLVSLSVIGVPVSAAESEISHPRTCRNGRRTGRDRTSSGSGCAFSQAEKMEKVTADAFWDAATEEDRKEAPGADTISYEQAKQLGLAPEED